MKFYGEYEHGIILTDDYDPLEVAQGLHLEHFKDDMWRGNIKRLRVYDESHKLITRLSM